MVGDSTGYVDDADDDSPDGAKTGAVGAPGADADRQLAWLNDVWGMLPEDVRAEVLDVVAGAVAFARQ